MHYFLTILTFNVCFLLYSHITEIVYHMYMGLCESVVSFYNGVNRYCGIFQCSV